MTRETLETTLNVRGSLGPVREALLFFQQSGWIKDLHVEPGDQVKEGQLLAEIQVSDLQDRIDDAQYDLDRAVLQLEKTRFQAEEISQLGLERIQLSQEIADLHVQWETSRLAQLEWQVRKSIAELDILLAIRQMETAKMDVQLAQQAVDRAQATLDRRKKLLEQTDLVAPFAGLITSIEKRIGESVTPFGPVGVLSDISELRIEAQILEENIDKVSLEQRAEVTLDAFPDTPYTAKVSQVASQGIIWQGQKAFRVLLALDPGQRVPSAIGMGADVVITTRKRTEALVVPNEALHLDGSGYSVDLLQDGKVRRQPVAVGISNMTHTEISSGLVEGETILIP